MIEVAYVVDIKNHSMWSIHMSKLLMVQANAGVTPPNLARCMKSPKSSLLLVKIFQTAMLLTNFAVLQ